MADETKQPDPPEEPSQNEQPAKREKPGKLTEPARPSHRRSKDTWVKLGFLAALLIIGLLVWRYQRTGPELEGWGDDLDAALATAAAEDRRVIVLFHHAPPGEDTKWMKETTLAKSKNVEAIKLGNYVRVEVGVDSADSPATGKYDLTELPTMLLLSSDGEELNRRTGRVGEVDFRNGFLDLAKIERPEP